jgi:class 3 adenylate cyclase/tetratricopeptide (TPR) repeat protein
MRCSACEAEILGPAQFCEECGAPVGLTTCPSCGAAATPGKRFCRDCGAALDPVAGDVGSVPRGARASRDERKQVTVLFCDIVGSTALAQRLGAEAMHDLLKAFFAVAAEEIGRYGGIINRQLGDGFMALVGVPVAHEDHARRAVLAAIGLKRRLAERPSGEDGTDVRVRIGLNSGLVVIGAVGDDDDSDVTAIGDTINVAARLERLAEPGSILISESTARLVSGYVHVEPVGALQVRGRQGPVEAYRVLRVGPRRSPIEGIGTRPLGRFVGRQRHLAALGDHLAQAREGGGQVVGIVAEPGMGKSRLITEFRRTLRGERLTVLEGRCLSFGSSTPYIPVADIVRANCGVADGDEPGEIAVKVRSGLAEVAIEPDEAAPFVLNLLSVREGAEALVRLTPEGVKARTFEILLAMCLEGSRRRPIVLVVEDLHWIDRVSEEFFAALAEGLQAAPILLICTYRPGYAAPWLQRSFATQLALPRLSPAESLEVVRWVLGREQLPDEVGTAIVQRGEGNPFFVEELVRAHRDGDAPNGGAGVPATIQDVLMARIDRLPDDARRVLQTSAVLGHEFSLPLLGAVWDGPGALDPELVELKRLEFLYEQPAAGEPVYVFTHALTQEVAYESLLTARREALHAAAGEALEMLYVDRIDEVVDRLAHHYARAGRAEKAVEYLSRVAERAVQGYAHVEAAGALDEALRHAPRLPADGRDRRILDLATRRAWSLHFLGRVDESLDLLDRHLPLDGALGDPRTTAEHHFWLGQTRSNRGDGEGAERAAVRAIADARRAGSRAIEGRAHFVLARECVWRGRLAEGAEHGRRAAALLDEPDQWWWLGHAHEWVARNLCCAGDLDGALEHVARTRAIGRERADPRLQSCAGGMNAWILATRGDWERAIADGTESLQLSPDPHNTPHILGWLGFAYGEKGDHAQAIALLERSIGTLTEFRYSRLVAWFSVWLGEAYLGAGRPDDARRAAAEGLRLGEALAYPWAVGIAHRALGRVALAEGDLAEAARHLDEARATLERIGARFELAVACLVGAELAAQAGEHEIAQERLAECLESFTRLNAPRYVERAARLAGEVTDRRDSHEDRKAEPPLTGMAR